MTSSVHPNWELPQTGNRQLAKLLSGNEVRGKVAIAAMQKAVNFTRSLSTWSRKVSDLPTDLLRVQDPFFFRGKRADLFDRKRRWCGMACSCVVFHRLSKAVSIFFFKLMLSRKSSISKTLMQQRRRGHACAVLPVWCAGYIIVKSVRQVPTLT